MTKLILVDDEKMILNSLSRYIHNQLPDFELCGCFYDGEEALAYLLEHPVDIVLTDICMPQMDGIELAKEISTRLPHCVVIILSGYGEFEYAQKAIKYNVFNYMLKPFDYRKLKNILEKARGLSAARRHTSLSSDIIEEEAELFFVDLFFGSIFSGKELKERFATLHFPFSLEESEGFLVKISLNERSLSAALHYEIDRLAFSLKNVLYFSMPDTLFYFVRKASFDYYYIAVTRHLPKSQNRLQIQSNLKEHLSLDCTVDLYHHFDSFKEFVQKKKTITANAENDTQTNDDVILKAIDYINHNFAQELSREMVAASIYLSPSHFSYLFKQKTGTSFMDYLTTVRMQKSIELLSTSMRINDIAEKIGYQNRNRFIINFRQYTGYTPTEYRKTILSMEDFSDEK